MEIIKGYIDHIIFHNEENGYTVLNFIVDGEELTCVGSLQSPNPGQPLELTGEYISHPTYGDQFRIEKSLETEPEDEEAIERYLGSGAIKGIGASLASRIVMHFGKNTFRIMEEEPERLAEVKGISERKAMEISDQVTERRDLRQAMLFLQQYGISLTLSSKIYGAYGQEIYQIMKTNPYRLAEDVSGIGFKIADEIAGRIGIKADSDFRIRSGIIYTLSMAAEEGHTFLPKELLKEKASNLLGVTADLIEKNFMDLSIAGKIAIRETGGLQAVYHTYYYKKELAVAAMLTRLDIAYEVPDSELAARIAAIEKEIGYMLAPEQAEAIRTAARNGLFVLTGGPGTGKTTTINAIIRYFEAEGLDIFLAAPTGRAAKRMSEMTGFEARTIHRMLEVNGGSALDGENTGGAYFERNENNPLETDVIIIDEMSMVDISLMHSLLSAVLEGTRLILVGDINQLPSVGPGSVLRDIIGSGKFHVETLRHIFRQAEESDIVMNAHAIHDGTEIALDNQSRDFFFLKRYDADHIIRVLLTLIREKLPGYVEAEPFDIQVLTPMRKGLLGALRLNAILQDYLNPKSPDKKEVISGDGVFREGDKVMETRNNYQIPWEIRSKKNFLIESGTGVFNGDLGVIRRINEFLETVTVEFDEGRMVDFPYKDLKELELAYATTIHKAQGSEYPAVLIPLLPGPKLLYNRNLLYTAVTRAKRCVVLVGDEKTFYRMIENTTEQERFSGLKERIREMEI